jgi:hypothetical protein
MLGRPLFVFIGAEDLLSVPFMWRVDGGLFIPSNPPIGNTVSFSLSCWYETLLSPIRSIHTATFGTVLHVYM